MRHMIFLSLASMVGAAACGGGVEENVNKVGEVGWRFNYRDWTKPTCAENPADCVEDDIRLCDNVPSWPLGTTIPAYDPITVVRMELVDPSGESPGLDREHSCAEGAGGKRIVLQGLAEKIFRLTLSAKTASGNVVLRLPDVEMNLATQQVETFEVPTVVGELKFMPRYVDNADPYLCPGQVETIRFIFADQDTGDVMFQGTTPACEQMGADLMSRELFLRNIPSNPEAGAGYIMYDMTLEALDADGTPLHCSTDRRGVSPGRDINSIYNSNPDLSAAACLD